MIKKVEEKMKLEEKQIVIEASDPLGGYKKSSKKSEVVVETNSLSTSKRS